MGSGYNQLYEFNFALFCDRFRLPPNIVRNSLLLLSRAGYIDFVDEVATRSRVIVVMNKRELYDLQLDAVTDSVFQLLLRTYTGLFSDYVIISEELIASRLQLSAQQVYEALLKLAREHAIHYVPRRSTPYIFFTTSRELPKHIALPRPVYEDQRRRMEHRVEAMRRFVFDDSECRVNTMLRYFGEQPTQPCGTCDVCRSRRRPAASDDSRMRDVILYLAGHTPPPTIDHIARQAGVSPARVIARLRTLLDEGVVTVTADGVVRLS